MTFSNPKKMDIFMALDNKYDLDEYERKCVDQGLEVIGSELEYAQKAGMILYAVNKYVDRTPFEAYMLLVAEGSKNSYGIGKQQASCSGCGGGELR